MKGKWLTSILAWGMTMVLLEVAHWDPLRKHTSQRLPNRISWAWQPAMAGGQKPALSTAPQPDEKSATPERLEGLLKEAKWKEAAIYEKIYPPQEKQGLKELRVIYQGLLKDSLKEENLFHRIQAAGALVEQGDLSFFGFLEEVRADQDPMARASAYQEMVEVPGRKGNATTLLSLPAAYYREGPGPIPPEGLPALAASSLKG